MSKIGEDTLFKAFLGDEILNRIYRGSDLIYTRYRISGVLATAPTTPEECALQGKLINGNYEAIPIPYDPETLEFDLTFSAEERPWIYNPYSAVAGGLRTVFKQVVYTAVPPESFNFYGCFNLESVDLSDIAPANKPRTLNGLCRSCGKLQSADFSGLDTSNATNYTQIFDGCSRLTTLNISSWNMSKIYTFSVPFRGCVRLTDLKFGYGLRKSLDLRDSKLLTHESALSVINGLDNIETNETVTFAAQVYSSLSEEEIAMATSKGWSVVKTN